MDRILPKILSVITRHPRERVEDLVFSKESFTACFFNALKLIFWRKSGIRIEGRLIKGEGREEFRAYTLEAACLFAEDQIRRNIKNFFNSFSFEFVQIPVLAFSSEVGIQGINIPYISFAIAFDTALNTSSVSTSTLTQSFTAASGNPLLLVMLIGSATNDNLTGITANGNAMTKIGNSEFCGRYLYMYYYLGQSGTFNVVSSRSATGDTYMQMNIASYTGVKQSAQPDASLSRTDTSLTSDGFSVTTSANNCWVIGNFALLGGSITSVTNGTQRASLAAGYGIYDSNGPKTPAGSFTLTVNTDLSTTISGIVASFAPAVAAVNSGFFDFM